MKLKSIVLVVAAALSSASAFADPVLPTLQNTSFETTTVGGGYGYGDVATGWSITGGGAVSSNGTAWEGTTTSGTHFGVLQNISSISQTFTSGIQADYSFSFDLALRGSHYDAGQAVAVKLDGQLLGTFSPTTSWSALSVSALQVAAGTHTLQFAGTNPLNKVDTSAFLDNVTMTVTPVPEPETYAMFLAGLGLMGAVARRRKQK